MSNFSATSSKLKKKHPGWPQNIQTPESMEAVRQAITQSPHYSTLKHTAVLKISLQTLRRILHADLQFHPCKTMVMQQLNEHDWISRITSCQVILENVTVNTIMLLSDEACFHLMSCVNKQNS